jgi:hypothetical protein
VTGAVAFFPRFFSRAFVRYEFIKNNKFQGLTLSLIRRFALQMLVSLRYLKQEKVWRAAARNYSQR